MNEAYGYKSFEGSCFAAPYLALLLSRPRRPEAIGVTLSGLVLGFFSGQGLLFGLGTCAAFWIVIAPYLHRQSVHPAIAFLPLYPKITGGLSSPFSTGLVFDEYLLYADTGFGVFPEFAAGRLLLSNSLVGSVCAWAYLQLPLAMVLGWAALSRGCNKEQARRLIVVFLALSVCGFIAYRLLPAIGPMDFFSSQYPYHGDQIHVTLETVWRGVAPRNCMPSLHTSWCLGLVSAIWGLGWRARVAGTVYALLMLIETTAVHYFVDLAAAVPFTVAVIALVDRQWVRSVGFAFLFGLWIVGVRTGAFGLCGPVLVWPAFIATVVAPFAPQILTTCRRAIHRLRVSMLNRGCEPSRTARS